MREQVIQIVGQYIDAVQRNDAAALPLHPDVVAEFPMSTYRGAAAYRASLEPFMKIVKSIGVKCLVADDEHCVALLEIDTAFGLIPLAEHIQVVDEKIVFIRGYYDPRPIVEGAKA
jgi:hypothetical protein